MGAPMKKRPVPPAAWLAALLVTLVVVVVLRFDFRASLEIDACEDAGGRWDRAAAACDFTPPQRQ